MFQSGPLVAFLNSPDVREGYHVSGTVFGIFANIPILGWDILGCIFNLVTLKRPIAVLTVAGKFGLGLYPENQLHGSGNGLQESPSDRPGHEQGLQPGPLPHQAGPVRRRMFRSRGCVAGQASRLG